MSRTDTSALAVPDGVTEQVNGGVVPQRRLEDLPLPELLAVFERLEGRNAAGVAEVVKELAGEGIVGTEILCWEIAAA